MTGVQTCALPILFSILGTNSEIVDKHYTHIGDEAQEKLISQLFGDEDVLSDKDRIDNALEIIDSLTEKSDEMIEVEQALRKI